MEKFVRRCQVFCFSVKGDLELELQLFKLYHNEREIDELASEMARKSQILEKETRKQQKIEDEVREKKKEHGKLIRDITKMEQQIKESVRLSFMLFGSLSVSLSLLFGSISSV